MDPLMAISFSLDRLEPFEVVDFLRDWRSGNLKSWGDFFQYVEETRSKPEEGDRACQPA
jgi:hypothetical protein